MSDLNDEWMRSVPNRAAVALETRVRGGRIVNLATKMKEQKLSVCRLYANPSPSLLVRGPKKSRRPPSPALLGRPTIPRYILALPLRTLLILFLQPRILLFIAKIKLLRLERRLFSVNKKPFIACRKIHPQNPFLVNYHRARRPLAL